MTARVVMVGSGEVARERLADALAGQYEVEHYVDSGTLCRALDEDPEMADVIVLSRHVPQPFSVAPGVLSRAADAVLLILCRPEEEQEYAHRLRITPNMNGRARLLPAADEAELPVEVAERVRLLGNKAHRRRNHRRTLETVQRQLDSHRPPQHLFNHYLEQLLDHLPIGILNVDSQGKLHSFNGAARRLMALSGDPGPDTPALDLFPEPVRQVVAELLADSDAGSDMRPHVEMHDENGRNRVIELSKSPVADYGGEPLVIVMLHDITESHNLLEHMRHSASHDVLTGLINRREFRARLETALAASRQRGTIHVLFYMDLDGFKRVNDDAGHQAGDAMLRQVADLMDRSCRGRDSLGRWGGDEFVLLLEHCSMEDAERVAAALVARVSGLEFHWAGRIYRVGISVGMAPVDPGSANPDELLSAADQACYAAKELGGNRVSKGGNEYDRDRLPPIAG